MRTPREIWPCGRFEVYESEDRDGERLNGFHTFEDAKECQRNFKDSVILDRQARFIDGMTAIYELDDDFDD